MIVLLFCIDSALAIGRDGEPMSGKQLPTIVEQAINIANHRIHMEVPETDDRV